MTNYDKLYVLKFIIDRFVNYWTGFLYFSNTNGGFVGSVRFGTHKFVLG